MKTPASPHDLASRFFPLLEDAAAVQAGYAEIGGCGAMLVYAKAAPARTDFIKALRYFELASASELPVVNCVDWSAAAQFAGLLAQMGKADVRVPVITLDGCPCILALASSPWRPEKIAEALNSLRGVNLSARLAAVRERMRNCTADDAALNEFQICRPDMADAPAIALSFEPFVAKRLILPRPEAEIAASLSDFIVAKRDGRIVGTVALRDFGNGLEEVRSLTVASDCEGRGLGSRLVSSVLDLARERGADRVFTLTMRPNIFLRLGFFVVSLMRFPSKVQNDCLACPKKEQCDEVALLYEMRGRGDSAGQDGK